MPIAAHATMEDGTLTLTGLVAGVEGDRIIRKEASAPSSGVADLGRRLAEDILAAGGREILEEVYCRELE